MVIGSPKSSARVSIDRGRGQTDHRTANCGGLVSPCRGRARYATAPAHPPSPQWPTRQRLRRSLPQPLPPASRNRQPIARYLREAARASSGMLGRSPDNAAIGHPWARSSGGTSRDRHRCIERASRGSRPRCDLEPRIRDVEHVRDRLRDQVVLRFECGKSRRG